VSLFSFGVTVEVQEVVVQEVVVQAFAKLLRMVLTN